MSSEEHLDHALCVSFVTMRWFWFNPVICLPFGNNIVSIGLIFRTKYSSLHSV